MNRRITTMVFLLLSIGLCAQKKTVRIDSIKVVYDGNYGLSIVEKISDGTYGVVDSKLTTIAPFEYDMIYPYHDKLALAYKDDQCGYLNLQGEIEIPFEYSSGNHFKNGKAVLVKEDKKGVIDTLNNILIPFKYYALATHDHEYYRYQLVKGKFGIMNDSQEIIVEPIYDKMSMKDDSLWVAKRDDKFIVLKNDGTLHNTTQFDKLGRIDSRINGGNFIWFEVDGKRGFLNSQYKTIISPQYERSGIDIGHIVSVYNGKKWGFIDISNNLLTGFIYDKIEYLNKEWSIIVKDGKFNIINKDAKEFWTNIVIVFRE